MNGIGNFGKWWKGLDVNQQLEPYSKCKPSGISWLGNVPEHWNLKKAKYVCRFSPDILPEETDSKLPIKYIDISAVGSNGKIGEVQEFNFEDAPSRARKKVTSNDTILSTVRTYLKAIGFIDATYEGHIASTGFSVIRPGGQHVPRFLFHWLRSEPFVQAVCAWSKGVGYPGITEEDLSALPVVLVPLPEQRNIAEFLDHTTAKLDELIAQKQRLIELLKEKRQALITQAVTKGLDPNVKMKDSGLPWLGRIPEHWEVLALKRLVSIPVTDGPHETPEIQDSGIPFVSAEAIQGGKIHFDAIRGFISSEMDEMYSKKYAPKKGDIYMVKSGATTGRVAMVETDQRFNIWSPLAAIRCNQEFVLPEFMLLALQSDYFQRQIQLFWNFGTQQNIGMGVIENLKLILPSVEEQREALEKVVELNDAIIGIEGKVEESILRLQEYRQSLISAAVTGKIDLREWKAS